MLGCLLAAALSAGCGLGPFGDEPGGGDNLPTRTAGPYSKLEIDLDTPADEPYVLLEIGTHYCDPSPLPRAGGGARVWFTRTELDAPDAAEIWFAELADLHQLPARAPERALAADAAWEEGWVGEPSVLDLGGSHLVLYYRGGLAAPAIGRADSLDAGATWTKHAANPIVPAAREPAAAILPDTTALYFVRPGAPGILAALAPDGVTFTTLADPVVAPRPELPDAFDPDAVAGPFALVTPTLDSTGLDAVQVGLFFAGSRPDPDDPAQPLVAIGYAGSYDGTSFQRFLGPDPILAGGPPSERAPGVLAVPAGGILFFCEAKQGRDRIAAAVHP